jgi:hypothetical protein
MRSSATVPTANARRYLGQLCQHFAHRVRATAGDREGAIGFSAGEVRLRAAPQTLMLVADADQPDGLNLIQEIVERHLRRYACREPDLAVEWRRAAG